MDVGAAYRVIEGVIERGFDIAGVSVEGTPFIVKTLSPLEMSLVRQHSFGKTLWDFRLYRLAYATYMVNGVSLLGERTKRLEEIVAMYKALPLEMLTHIEEVAIKLQHRYKRYYRLIDGFVLSQRSRILWRLKGRKADITDESTGIWGATYVGVSEYVDAWALTNMSLDEEEAYEENLSDAMYVASATNPKGVQKTQQKVESRKKMREEERAILVEFGSLAHKDLIEGNSTEKKDIWAASLTTTKDLVEELNRQMTGKKDKHDLFMDEYLGKLRKDMLERKRKEEEELAEIRARRVESPNFSGSFDLTKEELESLEKGETDLYSLAAKRFETSPSEEGKASNVGKRVLRPRG